MNRSIFERENILSSGNVACLGLELYNDAKEHEI